MIKTDRRRWLNAASASAAIFGLGLNAPAVAQDAGVHPGKWPQVRSRGLVDAATEARIDGLLA